jgi:ribonuclease R
VEGLVHISTLNDDLYSYQEKQHSLVGSRLRRVFRIGDKARVSVAAVSPATRRIEFTLAAHMPSPPPTRAAVPASAGEEYPRIPVRGKKVSGFERRSSGKETDEKGNGPRKGPPGGTKRR